LSFFADPNALSLLVGGFCTTLLHSSISRSNKNKVTQPGVRRVGALDLTGFTSLPIQIFANIPLGNPLLHQWDDNPLRSSADRTGNVEVRTTQPT